MNKKEERSKRMHNKLDEMQRELNQIKHENVEIW